MRKERLEGVHDLLKVMQLISSKLGIQTQLFLAPKSVCLSSHWVAGGKRSNLEEYDLLPKGTYSFSTLFSALTWKKTVRLPTGTYSFSTLFFNTFPSSAFEEAWPVSRVHRVNLLHGDLDIPTKLGLLCPCVLIIYVLASWDRSLVFSLDSKKP